ncbi:BMC domain-containing protein [Pseudoflavonifractor phocaeensis]|uniref:BMC domain-containing protein n=1 Tax=Pseudoflavonifractor phocaeensis TaxID=1870988 RepID=UPI00195E3283|nr:BMC domain-containing protein [Pseudoflavonifractor phocaeensis]MBM6869440.1 BMC domain-containing protein [Pseudoflavonifractor phocaeensis]
MGISIGLLELKSIPAGIETADEMLKAANVQLLVASPTCPGKYVIIVSGNVGAVKSSMNTGLQVAGTFVVSHHIINNVHESIPAAVVGTTEVTKVASLGVIETISALTAVRAGDIAAKASNITLMEIRIARGLGGKGFLMFTGEVSSVRSAVKACINGLGESGEITGHCVIPSPHADLVKQLM